MLLAVVSLQEIWISQESSLKTNYIAFIPKSRSGKTIIYMMSNSIMFLIPGDAFLKVIISLVNIKHTFG